ncbi:hypothetical protein QUV83_04930 [Cellulomonas cellasea]|uniref:hypothetical protein n=1 Tax=Cellulomonas cellasea TaxID=43670 RepID=UPI0025A4760C|nr:hypothetical protein [Cellulomonas cellasea]MDM8084106.1 hypothetical protein [Cellulomonas cellasea]
MKSSTKHFAGPVLGSLLTVGLIAGCSTPGNGPAATPLAASPSAAVTTAPEPVTVTAGDTVTEEQAEQLAEGQVAYPLASGEHVVVEATAPLPDAVRADMTAAVTAGVSPLTDGFAAYAFASSYAKSASASAGKNVLVVFLNPLGSFGDEEPHPIWITKGTVPPAIQGTLGLEEQIANVEAFIAAQSDPALWDYVVQTV